jgi:hypothetical protein
MLGLLKDRRSEMIVIYFTVLQFHTAALMLVINVSVYFCWFYISFRGSFKGGRKIVMGDQTELKQLVRSK